MRYIKLLFTAVTVLLLELSLYKPCFADENPFLVDGAIQPDRRLGVFKQSDTGDCFFLAALIAIAQDTDGPALIASAFQHHTDSLQGWRVRFPNLLTQPVDITQQELNDYKLTNFAGHGLSAPVSGDADIKLLEIAADKIWKTTIKSQGLWDDVPMNALYMFTSNQQSLIWNRNNATKESSQDIDKYKRIPAGVINEVTVSTYEQAAEQLKTILAADTDGISMILIDYINYHAVAITHIDFKLNTYGYIDTLLNIYQNQDMDKLFQGLMSGRYAINYLEIN